MLATGGFRLRGARTGGKRRDREGRRRSGRGGRARRLDRTRRRELPADRTSLPAAQGSAGGLTAAPSPASEQRRLPHSPPRTARRLNVALLAAAVRDPSWNESAQAMSGLPVSRVADQ